MLRIASKSPTACLLRVALLLVVVTLQGSVGGEVEDGPPALVGVSDCLIQNQCEYPRLSISAAKEYFRVYVRYAGPGPFTVTWHYSSGKPVDCSGTDSRCHIVTNGSTNVSTLTIRSPYGDAVYRQYMANVSNQYGYNESLTRVEITCPTLPNPGGLERRRQAVKLGEKVTVKCKGQIDQSAYLYLCYGRPGETFQTLNHSNSCVKCSELRNGSCGTLLEEDWLVYRSSETPHRCETYLLTVLTIPHVHRRVSGNVVYCYWSEGSVPQAYMTYSLSQSAEHRHSYKYYYYGAGGVIVISAIAVISLLVWRRRRWRRSEIYRNSETQGTYTGPGCRHTTVQGFAGVTTPLLCPPAPVPMETGCSYGSSQDSSLPSSFTSELTDTRNDYGAV